MDDSMDIDGSSYLQEVASVSAQTTSGPEPSSSAKKRGFQEFHQDCIRENIRLYENHQIASARVLLAGRRVSSPKSAKKSVRIISPRLGDFYSPRPYESPNVASSPPKIASPKVTSPKLPSPKPVQRRRGPDWIYNDDEAFRGSTYWGKLHEKCRYGMPTSPTEEDWQELRKIKGRYFEEPLRRRVSRTVQFVQTTVSSIWKSFSSYFSFSKFLTKPQEYEEVISVATDATNKKRRAIAASPSSSPSTRNHSAHTTTSHIPGDFPDTEMLDATLETVPNTQVEDLPKPHSLDGQTHTPSPSPSDLSDEEPDSDTDTETTIASPVQILSTPPDSRPSSSEGSSHPEKHDSPMKSGLRSEPEPRRIQEPVQEHQYAGYDRNIDIPLRYTPNMLSWSYARLAVEAKRQREELAEMQAKKNAAPAESSKEAESAAGTSAETSAPPKINIITGRPGLFDRSPEEKKTIGWYNEYRAVLDRKPGQSLRRMRTLAHSAQRNKQKDNQVDELVRRAKDIVLSPPHSKELSRSQTEQQAQKLADEPQEELVIPYPEVAIEPSQTPPHPELSEDHMLKQKIIRPLPTEWATKVDQAMATKNRREVLATTIDGTNLSRHDFGHILPQEKTEDSASGWLNDEIVNAWMSAIVEEKNKEKDFNQAGNRVPLFVAYASAWYQTYKAKGIDGISRWSRRKGIQGAKLLDCKKVFFPVNTGAHWCLLIISPAARQIEFLNSIPSGAYKRQFMLIAREFLKMELKDKYVADEWTELGTVSASQTNSDDCGLFVCYNGLISAKGTENYSDLALPGYEMTPNGRRLMAAVLINGGFHGDWKL